MQTIDTEAAALAAPAESASADVRTPPRAPIPNIGAPWPAGGTYVGIARGRDGEPDGHLVLLDDTPATALTWSDAVAWAEGLGAGARLPTRFESALLYAQQVQERLDVTRWHWTGTQYSAGNAWNQDFDYGTQDLSSKSYEARARAVRRFPL